MAEQDRRTTQPGDAAVPRAEEDPADRTRFELDAERWDEFLRALDGQSRELPRLAKLFRESSVFERETID
jgi:uncharacterized protein (DUF1778 family)